jgi:hypothetical protein
MGLKDLIRVRQKFDDTCLPDVEAAVLSELESIDLRFRKGSRIAITAGSRGIDNIAAVLRTVAGFVRARGGEPFLVPAMGSHGGATAGGQLGVLQKLGITEERVGAPILATMDAVELDGLSTGSLMGNGCEGFMPIYMDRNAYEADGIIAVNRIKPHTSFRSEVESGLMKMLVVGLGKELQAACLHSFGPPGLRTLIAPAARRVLASGRIAAGVGLVENAYDRLMRVKAFKPGDIEEGEKALLAEARRNMPRLPVKQLDVLVVNEIGKNFSGTGMDTNIIGRLRIEGEPEPDTPRIRRIAALGLSAGSGGNAYGIGLADVTTRGLVDAIDYKATYANALATTFFERVRLPLIADGEEEALKLALDTCGLKEPQKAGIIRVENTLRLESLSVSESVYEEIKNKVERL